MCNVKQRLISFLGEKRISKAEFGRKVGVSNAFVSSIKNSISPETLQKIKDVYPDLNVEWLLTGEGSMILGDVSGNNNAIGHGASATHSDSCNIVDKFLGELAEQRKLVSESQRQVDRLLSIIEKMTNNI